MITLIVASTTEVANFIQHLSPEKLESLVGLTGIVVASLGGAIAFLLGRGYQKFQQIEAANRSELALSIECGNLIIPVRKNGTIWQCIQTTISLKNISRRSCCILAVYTSNRPYDNADNSLIAANNPAKPEVSLAKLQETWNLAIMKGSVVQLGPEEEESFVRRDFVPTKSFRNMPLWSTEIKIFAAEYGVIGESIFGPNKIGTLREKWISFMASDEIESPTFVRFSRWGREFNKEIKPYSRFIITSTGEPDISNTRTFRKVLSAMTLWERSLLISKYPSGYSSPSPTNRQDFESVQKDEEIPDRRKHTNQRRVKQSNYGHGKKTKRK